MLKLTALMVFGSIYSGHYKMWTDWLSSIGKKIGSTARDLGKAVTNGIRAIRSTVSDYTQRARATLNQLGNGVIRSITLRRTPIKSMLNTALNVVSFGAWERLKQKYGMDKLFHLAMVVEVDQGSGLQSVVIEKNETINVSTSYKKDADTEIEKVPLRDSATLTVDDLLNNALEGVGRPTYFQYDPWTNNCQFFIKYLLDYSHLLTPPIQGWLFQDISKLAEELPSATKDIASGITAVAGAAATLLN